MNIIDEIEFDSKIYIMCPKGTTKEKMLSIAQKKYNNYVEIKMLHDSLSENTYTVLESEDPQIIITESYKNDCNASIYVSFNGSFSNRFSEGKFECIKTIIDRILTEDIVLNTLDAFNELKFFEKEGGNNILGAFEEQVYNGSFDLADFIYQEEMVEPFAKIVYENDDVRFDFGFVDTYSGLEIIYNVPIDTSERMNALKLFDNKINRDHFVLFNNYHAKIE